MSEDIENLVNVFRSMLGKVYIWRPLIPHAFARVVVKEVTYVDGKVWIGTCEQYPKKYALEKILYTEASDFLDAISQTENGE